MDPQTSSAAGPEPVSAASSPRASIASSLQGSTISSFDDDGPSANVRLPKTPDKWEKQAKRHKSVGGSIFDLDHFASASKITYEQFLHLRVLWTGKRAKDFADEDTRRTWLRDEHYFEAIHLLASFPPWKLYLDSLESPLDLQIAFPNLGTFSLVRYLQVKLTKYPENENFTPKFSPIAHRTRSKFSDMLRTAAKSPSRVVARNLFSTPVRNRLNSLPLSSDSLPSVAEQSARTDIPDSVPPISKDTKNQPSADDEQIVNVALVHFLNAVTMHFVPMADWSFERKSFQLGNKKNGKGYEARVDGFLGRLSDQQVMAILEVKPCARFRQRSNIRMQESGQMAAWICQFPDHCTSPDSNGNFTRLLVSQDRDEVYLTLATFGEEYVKYVSGTLNAKAKSSGKSNPGPFLRMNEFGPFLTNMKSHMKCLGYYILAFTLQECGQTNEAGIVGQEGTDGKGKGVMGQEETGGKGKGVVREV
ncbi:uncharacterized protein Z518_08744 [Rhinocladiella mackenziei CBS 650.93]|uniref:Uncharacterized protein n=1 Tax=Rhinocladiella mackenziei CBS 650.93 TaxID=1442369 RepID=A0A0D2IHM4_9EURO|nr:uncharacterized protein Z518_08744 [Rhinocladiella mackenziei CBS 650.93]KIX02801.1 hypothetical protein Z518_08744 [Rhinocladiella mackenziei CBS 650.93]